MTVFARDREAFHSEIARISREVAAQHADDVDRRARFPEEAVDALRAAGAMSAWVPAGLGGGGFELADIARACVTLARGCSATAMVFAMHQLQVATIVRHLTPEGWLAGYLGRLVEEQRLIASVTSELGTGGDMARSIAALEPGGEGRLRFEKQAPTISYGAYCDDLLTTTRRGPRALASDQVLVLHARRQTEMKPIGVWDTLGMRGTCSPGATIRAEVSADQVLEGSFGTMMAETIVPLSHILWAHLWLGIATEAFERGRAFVRAAARRAPGEPQPAARHLSEVLLELRLVRAEVASALEDFARWDAGAGPGERTALTGMAATLRFNALKLVVSERVPRICNDVLSAVGLMAYKNDSPHSVGRLLRDALSGQVMVTNERLHGLNASLLAITKEV
ncbi:MAG TPA: acyl-CoA dehydrogenase family protein [Solirubrobacteraceae bacterium]|nr:acyl-CoA dehydrogenase family protein [Solirubrobacteraceae bacterium]